MKIRWSQKNNNSYAVFYVLEELVIVSVLPHIFTPDSVDSDL